MEMLQISKKKQQQPKPIMNCMELTEEMFYSQTKTIFKGPNK